MSAPHPRLIDALRETADRLRSGSDYKWSNYGLCNCGHLAQTVTHLSPKEIHDAARQRAGDWGQQALEYCGQTGLEMDHIMEQLLGLGLTRTDIRDIERLSNPKVRRRMAGHPSGVAHVARTDAIAYFEAWADLLEEQLPAAVRLAAK
ncbi:MAG: hypothetical protein VX127_03685 [Myxococcota bacterium]|nr:hypothetical protein [Myxococcota bacterium]